MNRIKFLIIFETILFIVILTPIYYSIETQNKSQKVIEGNVTINGKTFEIELADEPTERSRGLMFRESLQRDKGMLFLFDREGVYSFWMMNVNFNLDIIWINSNGNVVHIEKDVPSCFESCPVYSPKDSAKYIFEINSGVADELHLQVGSFVNINITKE